MENVKIKIDEEFVKRKSKELLNIADFLIDMANTIGNEEADIFDRYMAFTLRFLQADIRVQNKINDSLRSSMNVLLRIHTQEIISGSKMEHMDIND